MQTTHKWLIAGLATALVLGITATGVVFAALPTVPHGVTVLGIDIGGKSKGAATEALLAGLAAREDDLLAPVTVKVENQPVTIQPGDVGLAVNVTATIERAAGRSALAALLGWTEIDPVIDVDEQRLVAALQPAADQLGTPPTLPAITFAGLTAHPVYPVPGRGLNPTNAAEIVTEAWLREPEAVVPIVPVIPVSTAADVDRMLAELALPAVAAPVTVNVRHDQLTLSPEQIAVSLVIDSDASGRLTPHVHGPALRTALKPGLAAIEVEPKDAGVADGQLQASTEGIVVDTAQLAKDLMPVLARGADRVVQATVHTTKPRVSSADLAALGIKEQVSTFTTYFSGGLDAPRSINIINGANEVDGAIVKPGQTFSLNGHTGPRGYAQGYRDAPIIMNGRLVPGVGGGLSQLATTLFNAAYYAGLEDVEHHPHSIYFSTYPSVVESTIFYPGLDLRFRNDTPHAILIDTSYTEDSLTVSMWSTRVYDSVTTQWSDRRDITEPKEVNVEAGQPCIARPGSPGFTQDAWRIFHKAGVETKREKFTWRYDAEPRVTCGTPPSHEE